MKMAESAALSDRRNRIIPHPMFSAPIEGDDFSDSEGGMPELCEHALHDIQSKLERVGVHDPARVEESKEMPKISIINPWDQIKDMEEYEEELELEIR